MSRGKRGYALALCALLTLAVLAVYWPVTGHDFVNFDDNRYVKNNEVISGGLTAEGVRKAFSTVPEDYWIPITWISYMIDIELFGMEPGGFHLTNLLLHLANTLLLFFVIGRMTGALFRSFVVAALFGLHPLHVESVAWVTERKDVLSTFFLLLSLGLYLFYTEKRKIRWYLLLFACACLGMMAKPALITLPLLLLLLDFWPLSRIGGKAELGRIIVEKVPLCLLSAVFVVMTLMTLGKQLAPERAVSITTRVGQSASAYFIYLGKMFWPLDLTIDIISGAVGPAWWEAALSLLALTALSALALIFARRLPFFAFGWFFYLFALFPASGIMPSGSQWISDRFTYVPHIGVYVALVWGTGALFARTKRRRLIGGITAVVILLALAILSHRQTGYWRDSETLARHSLAVSSDNLLAHKLLGEERLREGSLDEAYHHFIRALALSPADPDSHIKVAIILGEKGRIDEAVGYLRDALELDPAAPEAHYNLGTALMTKGDREEARFHYEETLRLAPGNLYARFNLALSLFEDRRHGEARFHFEEILRLDPGAQAPRAYLDRIAEDEGEGELN